MHAQLHLERCERGREKPEPFLQAHTLLCWCFGISVKGSKKGKDVSANGDGGEREKVEALTNGSFPLPF